MTRRIAIVTGGAQGIGRAIAEEFLRSEMRVAVVDCDRMALEQAEADLAALGEVSAHRIDVADPAAVENLVGEVVAAWGGIDVLVNNAGIMIRKPPEELAVDEWSRVLAVNLNGPFLCSRAAAAHLRKRRGAIVNIASTRALMSEAHTEAYAASKGGLVALTHALALSLGPEVRVNAISPGWIDVSGLGKEGAAGQESLSAEDHAQHPAGRVGTPGDIARAALFLADPANGFVTGQNFVIDGGMTRKMIYV